MLLTKLKFTFILLTGICLSSAATAQDATTIPDSDKLYWGSSIDGMIFSTSLMQTATGGNSLTPLRFTRIFNFGCNLNYDISSRLGIYTGIGIKNIGFVEKFHATDSTVKRRVYTLGIPVGVKIGNQIHRKFFFFGAGGDMAFNYREKGYIDRGNKQKFSEWFSRRTPLILPYAFAGVSIEPGITFKLQYYPANFLNAGFTDAAGAQPYAGYDVNLLMLNLGLDIHYRKSGREMADDARHMVKK